MSTSYPPPQPPRPLRYPGEPEERDVVSFPFAWEDSYRAAARPFGIRPDNAYVQVGERTLRAGFGRWLVHTPLGNVCGVYVTGPYTFLKTAGPPRLGLTDRGLTFATNGRQGVCIAFDQPVWGFDRLGLIRHPELTVTVEDPERLARLLAHRADFASSLRELAG